MKCSMDCLHCECPDCILDDEPLTAEEYAKARAREAEIVDSQRSPKERKLAAKQRAYREANKEELAAKQRAYYEANKEELAAEGRLLRNTRKAAGMTQVELARRLGLSQCSISRYEQGKIPISALIADWMEAAHAGG